MPRATGQMPKPKSELPASPVGVKVQAMIAEEIQALHRAVPFEPYTIHTSDGKAFYVKHPDYCLISPGGDTLWVFSTEIVRDIVATRNITHLEPGARKTRPRKR